VLQGVFRTVDALAVRAFGRPWGHTACRGGLKPALVVMQGDTAWPPWSVVGWPASGPLHGLKHTQLTHPAAERHPPGLGWIRGQPVLVVERVGSPIVARLVSEQGQIAVDDNVP